VFPDCAEPVIGRRFAPTRWLHPGYGCLLSVIASQRVGAKRRPMTGSAKQSIVPRKDWIAMTRLPYRAADFAAGVTRQIALPTSSATRSAPCLSIRHADRAALRLAIGG